MGIRQVLFIQGAGTGVHDDWDQLLAANLQHALEDRYEVRYPRMPSEGDPTYTQWSAAIQRELVVLNDGAIIVGHSVGAAIMIQTVAEKPTMQKLATIALLAAPFVGDGGWASDEYEITKDLGARLPQGVPVHIFHGLDDAIVPPSHANLYGRAIPQAHVHRLDGRDHQFNNDLSKVATAIR